jgi:hypothetical protein
MSGELGQIINILGAQSQTLGGIKEKVEAIDRRLESGEARFDNLEKRVNAHDTAIVFLTKKPHQCKWVAWALRWVRWGNGNGKEK